MKKHLSCRTTMADYTDEELMAALITASGIRDEINKAPAGYEGWSGVKLAIVETSQPSVCNGAKIYLLVLVGVGDDGTPCPILYRHSLPEAQALVDGVCAAILALTMRNPTLGLADGMKVMALPMNPAGGMRN